MAADLTLADQWINDGIKKALKVVPHLREKTTTLSTTASTQYIALPYDFEQVLPGVKLTISSQIYTLKPSPSREHFDRMVGNTSQTSDYASWFLIEPATKRIYLDKVPATSRSNVLTLPYKRRVKDLSIADYSTGNVQAIASGATALTGTGTTFTASMVGRFIRITESDTANKGDGEWYEIGSYSSATSIGLVRPYNGTSISAGTAAYVIGQMPILPEDYHDIPLDWALYRYYKSKNDNTRANDHFTAFNSSLRELGIAYARSSSPVLNDGGEEYITNPNLYITL